MNEEQQKPRPDGRWLVSWHLASGQTITRQVFTDEEPPAACKSEKAVRDDLIDCHFKICSWARLPAYGMHMTYVVVIDIDRVCENPFGCEECGE